MLFSALKFFGILRKPEFLHTFAKPCTKCKTIQKGKPQ
nr:MAG TPA: hypothetical protein [Caudoviricetes sp.]